MAPLVTKKTSPQARIAVEPMATIQTAGVNRPVQDAYPYRARDLRWPKSNTSHFRVWRFGALRRITDLQSVTPKSQDAQSHTLSDSESNRRRNRRRNDAPNDSDLAALIAAWPNLPEALKAGIAAIVEAAM
jgi:hypothetical protein